MAGEVIPEEFSEIWIPPPPPETTGQKFKRKIKENPFVPAGMYLINYTLYLSRPTKQQARA